ncbi:MAG: twin-arginine translocase subunit TatC, partial [Candidatus Margulisbacteria bacterium]|nr:twin-arginine translocase subunit TatC [Candidatus Margulisiibacteriota bacterium]
SLVISTLFEGFLMKLKLSVLGGIIVSFPVHMYSGIRFIFPGLKKKERRIIWAVIVASFLLAIFGLYMSYFQLIPFSVTFLTGTGFIPKDVGLLLNYKLNIQYVMNFILFSLILFQLPVVLELLLAMNVVNRQTLFRNSHYIVVAIFILTALVTPPDIISQIGLAVPLIFLFFITLLIAKCLRLGEG